MIIHVVRPGESLFTIGRLYGVPHTRIATDNELATPEQLVVGQTLVILEGTRQHLVVLGQSLYIIARDYGVTVEQILNANPQITEPRLIFPGQIINIPPRTKKLGTIAVNGYSFPFIDRDVLAKTLPYLTYLSIFSYEVREDGSLVDIDDVPLILGARQANVAPIMVITNIDEEGAFSSDLASAILNNADVQQVLIENIVKIIETKNYAGLDVDFEYIYPAERENYNNFIRSVTERLRPLGYTISSALAPKTFAEQPGILYEAHDYPVQGALLDHVILMTYEWGYTFGPPMAVAPLNQVRRVLDYAVTAIPRQKILMGIPNYGYDWTLPYVPRTAARVVGNVGAVEQAWQVGAQIQYDATSQAPFYNYYDSQGREHIVWFEDARSIAVKLRTVNEYNLGGVSYWTIGRFFPQNWLVLDALYNVEKVI